MTSVRYTTIEGGHFQAAEIKADRQTILDRFDAMAALNEPRGGFVDDYYITTIPFECADGTWIYAHRMALEDETRCDVVNGVCPLFF